MKYSDKNLNQIMPILEDKMKSFRTGLTIIDLFAGTDPQSPLRTGLLYDEKRFLKYMRSLGGSLVEDFYPEDDDDMDDEEWDRHCDHHWIKMEERTGMFPVLLPHQCGRYKGCLLPHELVDRILVLGFFP